MQLTTTLLCLTPLLFWSCSNPNSNEAQTAESVNYADLEMRGEQMDPVAYFEGEPYTGLAVTYAGGGVKFIEQEYKAGRIEGLWRVYFTDGQLQKEGTKIDGLEHGRYREWYQNGQLKYEYHYDMGKKTGTWLSWYEDGTRYTERNFRNDLVHGKVLVYDERGKLAKEYDYKDGRLIQSEMHFKKWQEE